MALSFIVFAAALAYANAGIIGAPAVATYSAAPAVSTAYFHQAGAPVAVAHAAPVVSTLSAAPLAIHAPAVGASHQSVERSLGGAQSVSHYSKAVDSAFSSVRKYDTRITNDALTLAHAPVAVAHAAPVVSSYSAPLFAKAVAPAVAHYSASPAVSSAYFHQAGAPVLAKSVAPVVSTYAAHATPVLSAYSTPFVTKSIAPVVSSYGAPFVTRSVAPVATYAAHAAPVVSAYSAAPVVTKSAAIAYSPASVVSHTTFTGLGAAYQW